MKNKNHFLIILVTICKQERKLAGTTHLESRMKDLEILVSNYADQINTLDTGLSAQVILYNLYLFINYI